MNVQKVEVDFLAGTAIDTACETAISYSQCNNNCAVVFSFNGIRFELSGLSDKNKAVNQYHAVCRTTVTGYDTTIGDAHQSAIDIIGQLEKELSILRCSQTTNAAARIRPLDCVATSGCKVDLGI